MVSQKCQYALRALFELAKHHGTGVRHTTEIALAQAIPLRFLEVIFSQLKQAGFVESKRGSEGGYRLSKAPSSFTVGQVIRFVEGPIGSVACARGSVAGRCRLHESCVFLSMWNKVDKAMSDVYDGITLQDLVEEEARMATKTAPAYAI